MKRALLLLLACVGCSSQGPLSSDASPDAPADGAGFDAGGDGGALDDLDRLAGLLDALAKTSDAGARAALVEAFLRAVAYGDAGFPIRARGKLAVVWWDPKAAPGPIALAGDHDGWSTSAEPLTQPIAGFPLWVRVEDDPKPAARALYKFVRGGVEWLADPWARRYGFDANGEYSLLEPGVALGHLERWPAFDQARGALEARTLAVWVPPGYDATRAPYLPLLVMQDGQNVFGPGGAYGSWHADDAAEQGVLSGDVRPFLIAAIPSTTARIDEYTPYPDSTPDTGTAGGQAEAYAAFVAQGVVPFVRARYRVRGEASETAVLGSSLGGVISLYAARRDRATFGAAAAMSPTTSWGSIGLTNPTIADLYAQAPPKGLRLYLDSGGDDGGGCAMLSRLDSERYHDQYCETAAFKDALVGLGWKPGADLFYVWAPGATHTESEWQKRLPSALRAWFPGK